jgi:hypothetical protein
MSNNGKAKGAPHINRERVDREARDRIGGTTLSRCASGSLNEISARGGSRRHANAPCGRNERLRVDRMCGE